MDFLSDILRYEFLANAILASISIGIISGIVGVYVVSRRVVFLTGGITHASFGGIGIAYYLGLNPLLGALIFAIFSSLGMQLAVERKRIREDSAIGVLWSIGMTIGVIFVFITPGYAPNLMGYLFGNILTISSSLIMWSFIVATVLLAFISIWHRTVQFVTFDSQYASTQGVRTWLINMVMMLFTAITIVLTLRLAGIVLLISLITLPSITAALLSKRYIVMTIYSSVIAVIGMVGGVFVSYYTNLPPGASIIAILTVIYVFVRLCRLSRRRLNVLVSA